MEKQIGVNRIVLKYIAVVAMVLDHVAELFVPAYTVWYYLMRVVGRLAAPIFCMCIAEGFIYTSNRLKYGIRLFVFAVVSQVAYAFAFFFVMYGSWLVAFGDFQLNVMFTLFIGYMMLVCFTYIKNAVWKWISVMLLLVASYFCDWGLFGPLWILAFYMLKDHKGKLTAFYSIVALLVVLSASVADSLQRGLPWYNELWQLGLFLFIPFIYLYNGQHTKTNFFNKWFFYVFYPLHLVVLGLIAFFI